MLADQTYGGHTSVHDDETAGRTRPRRSADRGTHALQPDRSARRARVGTAVVRDGVRQLALPEHGRRRRAGARRRSGPVSRHVGQVTAVKADGTPVLEGTASVGSADESELDEPSATSGGRSRRPVHRRPARDRHDPLQRRAGHDGLRRPQRRPLPVHARARSSIGSPSGRVGTTRTATVRGAVRSYRPR